MVQDEKNAVLQRTILTKDCGFGFVFCLFVFKEHKERSDSLAFLVRTGNTDLDLI